jgi:hypothetical protein
MNINFPNSSLQRVRVYLWASLNLVTTLTFAQAPAIKGAKTDNNYANTTEINKTKGASDAQVLSEIEGDYGLGDVVRIVITTPKPVTEPLSNSGHNGSSSIKMGRPPLPSGQMSPPIGNLPAPQQETGTPQYKIEKEQFPTPVTAENNNNPSRNGNFTPITNRTMPQQTAKPIVYEYYNSKGQLIPPPTANGNNNPNRNGDFTPIANRPAPQQTMKPIVYEYYDSKGRLIPPPTANGNNNPNRNGDFTPIANRPAPQQTAKPIVYEYYNSKGQLIPPPTANTPKTAAPTPNIANQTPNINVPIGTPNLGQSNVSNAGKKEEIISNETVIDKTISATNEKAERAERTERSSTRSESSGSSGGSRASKSSGFSFKNIFSGFGGSGMKTTKRRNMSSHKKYGCYRFN